MSEKPLVEVRDLTKHFSLKSRDAQGRPHTLKAVDGVNFAVGAGKTLGLVGESGCGKSTLGRTVLKLHEPSSGSILFKGQSIEDFGFSDMRPLRQKMQMIFQDPYASLNPRMTIAQSVQAPLDVFRAGTTRDRRDRVKAALSFVGLEDAYLDKYPHEMSGGQRQRVVIARAMILQPEFIVCDEPVSALDVSIRSQVLNLMKKAQAQSPLAYLFISHDLSVVNYLCDSVAVMYLGKIVEIGSRDEIFHESRHPYTKALLSAVLVPDVNFKKERIVLKGETPSPLAPPTGCKFRTRCPFADEGCALAEPALRAAGSAGHQAACHKLEKIN